MKKFICIITVFLICLATIFSINSYAQTQDLNSIDIQTDKTTVRPGEEVKITVNFGENLGAYTFDFAYDNSIFEYVSADGGTANDTGTKVRVTFYDSTGGTNPRTNMSIIFKAKEGITTSNPTEFSITAEGLANNDASVSYNDITTPIVKNVTVEPEYQDYTITLEPTGNVTKGIENELTLNYGSPMGRYYEHARLIAEATTPGSATVQLLGTDEQNTEHDIIQSGWGDAQGYKIGGKDVSQTLKLRGIFSDVGDYTITLKLIDRDNSDSVIAEKTFNFTAVEQSLPSEGNNGNDNNQVETPENTITPEEEISETEDINNVENNVQNEEKPSKLPKTGNNIYVPIAIILVALISFGIYYNKKK